jgi:hypothetical protein
MCRNKNNSDCTELERSQPRLQFGSLRIGGAINSKDKRYFSSPQYPNLLYGPHNIHGINTVVSLPDRKVAGA